jgi:hypothetical protein
MILQKGGGTMHEIFTGVGKPGVQSSTNLTHFCQKVLIVFIIP